MIHIEGAGQLRLVDTRCLFFFSIYMESLEEMFKYYLCYTLRIELKQSNFWAPPSNKTSN